MAEIGLSAKKIPQIAKQAPRLQETMRMFGTFTVITLLLSFAHSRYLVVVLNNQTNYLALVSDQGEVSYVAEVPLATTKMPQYILPSPYFGQYHQATNTYYLIFPNMLFTYNLTTNSSKLVNLTGTMFPKDPSNGVVFPTSLCISPSTGTIYSSICEADYDVFVQVDAINGSVETVALRHLYSVPPAYCIVDDANSRIISTYQGSESAPIYWPGFTPLLPGNNGNTTFGTVEYGPWLSVYLDPLQPGIYWGLTGAGVFGANLANTKLGDLSFWNGYYMFPEACKPAFGTLNAEAETIAVIVTTQICEVSLRNATGNILKLNWDNVTPPKSVLSNTLAWVP